VPESDVLRLADTLKESCAEVVVVMKPEVVEVLEVVCDRERDMENDVVSLVLVTDGNADIDADDDAATLAESLMDVEFARVSSDDDDDSEPDDAEPLVLRLSEWVARSDAVREVVADGVRDTEDVTDVERVRDVEVL
jgi:hypothetical protein